MSEISDSARSLDSGAANGSPRGGADRRGWRQP